MKDGIDRHSSIFNYSRKTVKRNGSTFSRMEPAQQLIGRLIRSLREQRGLTLEQLASRAGITYQYLSGVENGKENFTIAVLEKIAEALPFSLSALVTAAYHEEEALATPHLNPQCFRPGVPLPEGLIVKHLETAANQTVLVVHRINRHLVSAARRPLQRFIQGNNFSGLVSNILCDALDANTPYRHNSHQKHPDLINPSANQGKGEGLEVKSTVKVGKGGESHNGHGGWHLIACFRSDDAGDIHFLHLMCACLCDHRANPPDWKYVGSQVNAKTGSQRTETYVTTPLGTTKLRDGTVYIDPSIDFRRWKQARAGQGIPPWSIFFSPEPQQ
jgi:transcriptional regulator with XRE-family HTH domain